MEFRSLLWFLIPLFFTPPCMDIWLVCAHKGKTLFLHSLLEIVHIFGELSHKRQCRNANKATNWIKIIFSFLDFLVAWKTSHNEAKVPSLIRWKFHLITDRGILFEISLAWAINQPFTHIHELRSYVFMLETRLTRRKCDEAPRLPNFLSKILLHTHAIVPCFLFPYLHVKFHSNASPSHTWTFPLLQRAKIITQLFQ